MASRCAARVSSNLSGASFLIRRNAKIASALLSAALAATASRFARRFAFLALCMLTASRHVSQSQKSRSGQMFTKGISLSRLCTIGLLTSPV
eukprot:1153561-Pleurochrysis_carterae.AAC.1